MKMNVVHALTAAEAVEALVMRASDTIESMDEVVIVVSRNTFPDHGGTGLDFVDGFMAELVTPREPIVRGNTRWAWLEVD